MPPALLLSQARESCRRLWSAEATAAGVAPGRVEVLGNHTDYNDGYVLSAAIDRYTAAAGRASERATARIYAASMDETIEVPLDPPARQPDHPWADYVLGVADAFRRAGLSVGGFDLAIHGDVPLGAGLSSSASLEVAVAHFLCRAFGHDLPRAEMARLCQRAENGFVGMNCGLLDQWSSLHGAEGSLLFLDFRTFATESLPLGSNACLVLANTHAPHALVDGAYNRLRAACHEAAALLARRVPGATHLRDISPARFAELARELPESIRSIARHIVTENDRVLRGVAALRGGDLAAFGERMRESHASSRDDFGNSCRELDLMADLAGRIDGCYGSRLSGGGFGGSTVNLVAAGRAEAFRAELAAQYESACGLTPEIFIFRPAAGAWGEGGAA